MSFKYFEARAYQLEQVIIGKFIENIDAIVARYVGWILATPRYGQLKGFVAIVYMA